MFLSDDGVNRAAYVMSVMDRELISADEQAERLWSAWGADAFAVTQRRIDAARDRMQLDDVRYWLDVETCLYGRSNGLRAA